MVNQIPDTMEALSTQKANEERWNLSLMEEQYGAAEPFPHPAWRGLEWGMLLVPITPKCFTVHQIPALNI